MQYRERRVADAIRDVVAEVILTKLADPRIGFVTVTRCSLSRDLRNATVYFSVLGSEEDKRRSLAHLEHARGFIKHQVAKRIKLKFMPEIHFALDEVLAKEQRIGELLNEINPAVDGDAGADDDGSEV